MGYFSEILAQPAAQQAGRMTLAELQSRNVVGEQVYSPLFKSRGFADPSQWSSAPGGNTEGGAPMYDFSPTADALKQFDGYTFDWKNTGPGNTGTLTAYDPSGVQHGQYNQTDTPLGQSMLEAGALYAAGFGGAGLLGLGPLGGLLGSAGAAGTAGIAPGGASELAAYGATLTPAEVTASATGLNLGGAGAAGGAGTAVGGSGLLAPTLGNSAGLGAGLGTTGTVGTAGTGTGAATSSGLLGNLASYLPAAKSLASIASGVYGMSLAGDMRNASDPFAQYRPGYGQQLAALEANPGSIATRPGFQAGLETIGRKSAASGYYGSGNMASALSRYSGDFYNQEAGRLAGLAGANQTPGAGQAQAADLASQSLGSIGYGIGPLLQRLTQGG